MTILLIAMLAANIPVEECPVLLVAKGYGAPLQAQTYADCISRPWLPAAGDLPTKKQQCAVAAGRSTKNAISWVDTIATNFPGCETRLTFKRK